MSSSPKKKMTAAEYLETERAATTKSFFYHGEMYSMSGASRKHCLIVSQLSMAINLAFQNRKCEVYINDMRVKNARTNSYFYPDVVATCEAPRLEDEHFDTLINPQVVIEVLSNSTETFDRSGKFDDYKLLDSLKEYVLVSQDRMRVERYTRKSHSDSESVWEYWSSSDPGAVLQLDSIGCKIKLSEIYAKVDFDETPEGGFKVIEEKLPLGSSSPR